MAFTPHNKKLCSLPAGLLPVEFVGRVNDLVDVESFGLVVMHHDDAVTAAVKELLARRNGAISATGSGTPLADGWPKRQRVNLSPAREKKIRTLIGQSEMTEQILPVFEVGKGRL